MPNQGNPDKKKELFLHDGLHGQKHPPPHINLLIVISDRTHRELIDLQINVAGEFSHLYLYTVAAFRSGRPLRSAPAASAATAER